MLEKHWGNRPLDWDWRKDSEMFDETADYYEQYGPIYPEEIIGRIIFTPE